MITPDLVLAYYRHAYTTGMVVSQITTFTGNYSGMLIGLPIAVMYFLARKITAEGAEERYKRLTVYFHSASLCTLCG